MTPPVIPAMKIRHLNPRQMISIPEQRVTVRHPVLKAPPGKMRHTAEFMNLTPGRPATTANRSAPAAACQPHSARADHRGGCGPAPQSHPASLPAASPPATSGNTPPAHRRYSRRENIFPPSAFSPRSHTTPLAHIAGRAPESLILSVSWDYCESLLMERKPPKLPTLLRNLQPLRHLLHLSFVISDVGWSYSSATAGPL